MNTRCSIKSLKFLQGLLFAAIFYNLHHGDAIAEAVSPNKYDEDVAIIPLRDDCSTTEPIEKYSVRNGEIEGILYATTCEGGYRLPKPLVDYVKYVFIDTGGTTSERCYGIINTSTPSGIQYSWEFKGAVPGYSCSKINRTINRLYPKGY